MALNPGCNQLQELPQSAAMVQYLPTNSECDPNKVLEQLFECPSSNERNTNTLFSGSDSDAVKTPSVGSDSPGFGLHEVPVPVLSAAPLAPISSSLIGSPLCSPPAFPQASVGPQPMPAAPPTHCLPMAANSTGYMGHMEHASPTAPLLPFDTPVANSVSTPVMSHQLYRSELMSPAVYPAAIPVTATPIPPSVGTVPSQCPTCGYTITVCTCPGRLSARQPTSGARGAKVHAPRGRPLKKFSTHTYHSRLSDETNPLKLTIRVERSGAVCSASSVRGARGRRRHRRRSRHRDSDDDGEQDRVGSGRGTGAAGSRRGRRAVRSVVGGGGGLLHSPASPGHSDSPTLVPSGGWGDSERMPVSLLRRVFGELVACDGGAVPCLVHAARVCRLWRSVAGEPELWRSVDLNCSLVPDHQRHVRTLLWLCENRLSLTQELSLAGWQSVLGPASVGLLCDSCRFLQSLSVSGCRSLTSDMLFQLCTSLPQLQQLEMSDVQPTMTGVHCPLSQPSLQQAIDKVGARLRSLNISHNCVSGIPAIVDLLASHCPQLELLDLSNMQSMVRDVVAVNIERLQQGCPHMRVLRWTNTQLKLADTTIKEQISSGGFPELEELSVAVPKGATWGVDDTAIQRLLKTSTRLLLLDVRGCERLTDGCLVRVPASALQHLYLSGTQAGRLGTISRLELLVAKWRHSLCELDLSWASQQQAVDSALQTLCDDGPVHKLCRLQLAGSAATFAPLARLVLAAPNLQHLDLTSCRSLPRGIKRPHVGCQQLAMLRQQICDGRFDEV